MEKAPRWRAGRTLTVLRHRDRDGVPRLGVLGPNALVESFNGEFRDGLPVIKLFHSLLWIKLQSDDSERITKLTGPTALSATVYRRFLRWIGTTINRNSQEQLPTRWWQGIVHADPIFES